MTVQHRSERALIAAAQDARHLAADLDELMAALDRLAAIGAHLKDGLARLVTKETI